MFTDDLVTTFKNTGLGDYQLQTSVQSFGQKLQIRLPQSIHPHKQTKLSNKLPMGALVPPQAVNEQVKITL